MRRLGTQYVNSPSSNPALVVMLFASSDGLPKYAWAQESETDVLNVLFDNVLVPCRGILDDVSIRSTRPTSGGGLRRNTTSVSFNTEDVRGFPLVEDPILKSLYYGGSNFDDFYFGIYAVDRTNLLLDIRLGACYGHYKVDNEITWTEDNGVQSINLIDILLSQETIVGATDETIPDLFFIYNPQYKANFFPKVYGQVPRIIPLNAFPSFGIKNFSASISGQVRSVYTNVSTEIILEENTGDTSLLLQAANLGGTVRIRMSDGEVIAGTLDYDSVAETITLVITERNTYYNRVAAYNDSLDGRSPDQWGSDPSYATVRFSPFQTIIPNAKQEILDQNGFMRADIWFFDTADAAKGFQVTDCVCQIQGILEERKDVVIHSYWPDSRYPSKANQGSISGYYSATSNSTFLGPGQTPLWGYAGFEFLKFRDEVQSIDLFFNDPSVSVAGSGAVGDPWSMVSIEPETVDNSCYIRNGYSLFDVDHVYCEGEGKLIKIPSGNITITQSGTFYGLANLCKIAFTDAPLDMNIGAKSNTIYIDALYRDDAVTDTRAERILFEILKEDATLVALADDNISSPVDYQEDNYLPYIGWYAQTETKLSEIIDKICYQCGITMKWDFGKFKIEISGWARDQSELTVEVEAVEYIRVLAPQTTQDEMLENSAGIKIGKLRTAKYAEGEEYVPLYFKATYGGWMDPYYAPISSSSNRNIKPLERIVEYHFDLINDTNSFLFAVGRSLCIGHPSGYTLAQRYLIADMVLDGGRWEAMNPIIFADFPLISTVGDTNAIYDDEGHVLYPKRTDGKAYIMGAVCSVDDVTYQFSIEKPMVHMVARNSQTFVLASGLGVYNPPGTPLLPPGPPTDPNTPPNPGGGSGGTTVVGNDMLMPEIVSEISSITIDSTDTYDRPFTITVDAGFIFNKGWSYRMYVENEDSPDGESTEAHGAWLTETVSASFPDKVNDLYVPPIYDVSLHVNYQWFANESEGTTFRGLQIMLIKYVSTGGEVEEIPVPLPLVFVTRVDITGVSGA